ncbi:hypothetical protein J2S17_003625 [Cytobacillus purgationiresistens]|uniref:Uncharacterized protein n=1 Tax=Cytobacillus purgationiresistens TaxID=863449 RepID=A0ABU0AKD8_9BACI|nr:hypothetical protein [Cytobacillus purgationiresistens]
MSNWLYIVYALILGVVSIFTGEIITFVMLGFISLSLFNINSTLLKIYHQNNEKNNNKGRK